MGGHDLGTLPRGRTLAGPTGFRSQRQPHTHTRISVPAFSFSAPPLRHLLLLLCLSGAGVLTQGTPWVSLSTVSSATAAAVAAAAAAVAVAAPLTEEYGARALLRQVPQGGARGGGPQCGRSVGGKLGPPFALAFLRLCLPAGTLADVISDVSVGAPWPLGAARGRAARMPSAVVKSRRADTAGAEAPPKGPLPGFDSQGREFESATAMWREYVGEAGVDGNLGAPSASQGERGSAGGSVEREGEGGGEGEAGESGSKAKREKWYEDGLKFWQGVEASDNGVLCGYANLSPIDLRDSRQFLAEVYSRQLAAAKASNRPLVALDCGAGVGRITKGFLLKVFNQVDLVEPVAHFLARARADLRPEDGDVTMSSSSPAAGAASEAASTGSHVATNFYCMPLQDFTPEAGRYDVIWIQWCIGHLTDTDFIAFFRRALKGLRPGGIVVLKENIAASGFVLDNSDSSVTRSDAYFRSLFHQAGLRLLKTKEQKNFPSDLFGVRMYALQAKEGSGSPKSKRAKNEPKVISV